MMTYDKFWKRREEVGWEGMTSEEIEAYLPVCDREATKRGQEADRAFQLGHLTVLLDWIIEAHNQRAKLMTDRIAELESTCGVGT